VTTSLVPPPSGGPPPPEAPAALSRASTLLAPAMEAAVSRLDPSLHDPVRHHLAGGGKHVRAGLVLLASAAVGGTDHDGLVGAVAVELVHNYSLLHDDIIDGDRERRHRPTVWARYGVGVAIVVGDALAALAMQLLLDDPAPRRVRAAQVLATANQRMIGGQSADMTFEGLPAVGVDECLAMERGKTGALLSAACAVGGALGGGTEEQVSLLAAYGENLGIAFQAVDDLLGIWGEASRTGKPVGADLVARKKTLPVSVALAAGGDGAAELEAILGGELTDAHVARATRLVEAAGARDAVAAIADNHLRAALAALDQADLVPAPKEELMAVARYVTARDR
jgi:geranylgeranyl diphosphate synthase type I